MTNYATGKTNGTVWFQQTSTNETKAEAAALGEQVTRMKTVLARLTTERKSNPRLKSQIREKNNLLRAAIDYANGERAYYPIPRSQRVSPPRTDKAFLALVAQAVADITPMFERANVSENLD
jgi:hypothetical protein